MITVTPPNPIYDPANIDVAFSFIRSEVGATCKTWAGIVQDTMRSNAPWSDRNGPSVTGKNARDSLEAEVGKASNGDLVIVARSTRESPRAWRQWEHAPVGAFLELGTRYMAKRAVIWPTMNSLAPDLGRMLDTVMKP